MSSESKKSRTVRLDPSVDSRLVELCKHIGTNPNAYLVAEIGKAISRDEVSLRAVKQSSEHQALLFEQIASMVGEQINT